MKCGRAGYRRDAEPTIVGKREVLKTRPRIVRGLVSD